MQIIIKLKNWKPNPDRANQAASGSHCSLLVECKAVSQLLLELFAPFLEQMCDFVGDSFATSLIFCLGMGHILCTIHWRWSFSFFVSHSNFLFLFSHLPQIAKASLLDVSGQCLYKKYALQKFYIKFTS